MITALIVMLAVILIAMAVAIGLRIGEEQRRQEFYLGRRLGAGEAMDLPAPRRQTGQVETLLMGFALRAGIEPDSLPPWAAPGAGVGIVMVLLVGAWLGVLLGLLLFLALASVLAIWLLQRERRRVMRMREQMPGFLEHMMRVLSTGNSLEEALSAATQECPAPLGEVFAKVSRQVRLGAAVDETLTDLARLSGLRELQVLALATKINRRYGGSLKRIFKSLISAIHQQDAARREMRALTAETRFSALILAIVPTGMMLWILSQNPGYYADMWANPRGQAMLLFSGLLQVMGVLIIWRMLGRAAEDAI